MLFFSHLCFINTSTVFILSNMCLAYMEVPRPLPESPLWGEAGKAYATPKEQEKPFYKPYRVKAPKNPL